MLARYKTLGYSLVFLNAPGGALVNTAVAPLGTTHALLGLQAAGVTYVVLPGGAIVLATSTMKSFIARALQGDQFGAQIAAGAADPAGTAFLATWLACNVGGVDNQHFENTVPGLVGPGH